MEFRWHSFPASGAALFIIRQKKKKKKRHFSLFDPPPEMSQEPRMDDNKNLVSTFLYRQGPSVVLYPRNASANVRRKLYIINNRWRRAPPWWEIVMGPVLECVLEKKGRKRDDSSLRRKYHHLLVQNPMTITMDDLFRSKLPPKEAKLLCVCVWVFVYTTSNDERRKGGGRTEAPVGTTQHAGIRKAGGLCEQQQAITYSRTHARTDPVFFKKHF